MLESGKLVINESLKITPVEFGDLRKSVYTQQFDRGEMVEVGYTASYAARVHEMPMHGVGMARTGENSKGTYWDRGENKFLEKALRNNQKNILDIIRKESTID